MKFAQCKCGTPWYYNHTVYSGMRGGGMIRRWCPECKAMQVGLVSKWRGEREDEFDHFPWDEV